MTCQGGGKRRDAMIGKGEKGGRQAAASFARLDPNQTWGALPGPGAAARPVLAPEWGPVAGKPQLSHALALGADRAGKS